MIDIPFHRVDKITMGSIRKLTGEHPVFYNCDLLIKRLSEDINISLFSEKRENLVIGGQVVLHQKDGIVELVSKSDGIKVRLFDYDLDGVEQIDIVTDDTGKSCIVTNWE